MQHGDDNLSPPCHFLIASSSQIHLKTEIDPNFRVRSAVNVVHGASKPKVKPQNPEFSSGPCKKRPGYDVAKLRTDTLGRSHRSKLGKARLKKAIDGTLSVCSWLHARLSCD